MTTTSNSTTRSGLGRSVLFAAAGIGLALLFCFVLVEVGLRVYSRVTPNVDVEFYRYASLMKGAAEGSAVGFRHKPNSRDRFFGVDVEINSQGFRDVEFGPKDEDALYFGLLGDSVTFGWGVAYGDRFSERLEDGWSRVWGQKVHVLNTGHGNYNSAQEYATLVESFDAVPLDGLLQVWYINDAEPTPPHRVAPWYARFHTAIFLWAKSDLVRRRFGARESFVTYYRDLYREDAPGYAQFHATLKKTGAWAAERGVPWVFVVLPELHAFPAEGPFQDIYEHVATLAREAGATVIDVTPAFRDVDPETVWVAYNDVHPNAKGHAIIADAILRETPPTFGPGAGS